MSDYESQSPYESRGRKRCFLSPCWRPTCLNPLTKVGVGKGTLCKYLSRHWFLGRLRTRLRSG